MVVWGSPHVRPAGLVTSPAEVAFGSVRVYCGLCATTVDATAAADGLRPGAVLVRVAGFSLNFRDRALIERMLGDRPGEPMTIGSEFVGQVLAVGAGVTIPVVGQRVIADCSYADRMPPPRLEGIPTNHASAELLVVAASQVRPVPSGVPDHVACAVGLNAQTAYAMIRRLAPRPGERVAVFSSSSNTALAALQRLKMFPVDVIAFTRSPHHEARLQRLNVGRVVTIHAGAEGGVNAFADMAQAAVDPFFDVNCAPALRLLTRGGRYVTCGAVGAPAARGSAPHLHEVLFHAIVGNLTLSGNCLGRPEDLDGALEHVSAAAHAVTIDSVFRGSDAGAFLARTFSEPQRFGKVVFMYD